MDNVDVRTHRDELADLISAHSWESSTYDRAGIEHLSKAIAPLLRYLPDVNLSAMTFEVLTERLALAYLSGQVEQVLTLRDRIVQELKLLPTSIEAVRVHGEKVA
jgi:type I restriction enzyme R subunit